MTSKSSVFAGTVNGAGEHSSTILPDSKGNASEPSLTDASGNPNGPTYLERKALAAQGMWGRVTEMPNGCWEWQGSTTSKGYPQIAIGAQQLTIHRLITIIFNRPLGKEEYACHACNNKRCINPKHLTIGTPKDNFSDRREHGPELRKRKITDEDVSKAQELLATGKWTLRGLAKHLRLPYASLRRYLIIQRRPA